MCDFVQQFIRNERYPNRDDRFLDAIDDGHVILLDNEELQLGTTSEQEIQKALDIVSKTGGGYLDEYTFCISVAFTSYIVWYRHID